MYKTRIFVLTICLIPSLTTSSFLDVYTERTERVLGQPTQAITYMKDLGSYGQKSTVTATIQAPQGKGSMVLKTDMRVDKQLNSEWTMRLVAKWTSELLSGSMDVGAEIIMVNKQLYVKPTLTNLPTNFILGQQAPMKQLDGKWLHITTQGMPTASQVTLTDPLALSREVTKLVQDTPVFTLREQTARNGYEVYIVDIDPVAVQKLITGILATVTAHGGAWLPTTLPLPSTLQIDTADIRTYGVIWKKDGEIKMGMIMKKATESTYLVLSSRTTETTSQLIVRVLDKTRQQPTYEFIINTTLPHAGAQEMSFDITIPQQQIDIAATISTQIYDGWVRAINAPLGAITLEEALKPN